MYTCAVSGTQFQKSVQTIFLVQHFCIKVFLKDTEISNAFFIFYILGTKLVEKLTRASDVFEWKIRRGVTGLIIKPTPQVFCVDFEF